MIDYIKGKITELTPTVMVVECGGIGYEINITLIDYSKSSEGADIKIYIHESIREDAHVLFGFLDRRSRELFRLLIGVSGVGPAMARLILSAMEPDELRMQIAQENIKALKAVKGVGVKTAQRIIVDLKDKINSDNLEIVAVAAGNASEAYDDALAALQMLGFAPSQSRAALDKIFKADPAIKVEKAIKQALTML